MVAGNLAILGIVSLAVISGSSNGQIIAQNNAGQSAAELSPLDQLSSADIAVNISNLANLPETPSVRNLADTANAGLAITTNEKVVSKPQIVSSKEKTRFDVKKYAVVDGDSVTSIAAKFSVTSDSIRLSNGITGDRVPVGKELLISPVSNGVVYTVKSGDTAATLAEKFRTNKDQITAFNDAEIKGLQSGEVIVIPDAQAPVVQPTRGGIYSGGSSFAWGGSMPVYSANGYDRGYCTWYVALKRSQAGRPIPSNLGNASTWKTLSQRAGLAGSNVPQAGAVIWFPPYDFYGHVGYVESVGEDGSVNVSEMNVKGWNRVSTRTISPAQAGNHYYIY